MVFGQAGMRQSSQLGFTWVFESCLGLLRLRLLSAPSPVPGEQFSLWPVQRCIFRCYQGLSGGAAQAQGLQSVVLLTLAEGHQRPA